MHIPFCPSKCGYCDFNSYAMTGEIIDRTVAAIRTDIRRSPWRGIPAKTIFFGGGTPTYLPVADLIAILDDVRAIHPPIADCEITSEANPGTVDAQKFDAMHQAGFNRVSLGAQSFLDDDLLRLDRVHRGGDIERAYRAARAAGFRSVNLDLMFALPHQSLHAWRQNLDRALSLEPEHISLYCLTIEENTAFYKRQLRGEITLPDDEDQVAMYNDCVRETAALGYRHYEISNFAKAGRECRHNLAYWHGEDYAAYGPGAVGCMDGVRYTNLKHPRGYSEAVENRQPVAYDREPLTARDRRNERVMLGLRLDESLPDDLISVDDAQVYIDRGWLARDATGWRLTPGGRHFASEVAIGLMWAP